MCSFKELDKEKVLMVGFDFSKVFIKFWKITNKNRN